MKKFLSTITLALGLTLAMTGTAQAGAGRWGEDLRFVSETQMPTPTGGTYSLCYLVDFMDVLFVPIYTSIESYALSADSCTGDSYRPLSAEQVESLQMAGLLSADLPVEPKLGIKDLIVGHAGILLALLAGFFKVLAWFIHDRKPRRRAKTSDALTVNALAAMCHVAVSDGHIDESEVSQIAAILTRLTGRGFDRDRVRGLLNQILATTVDVNQIGADLTEQERRIVMEAALNIAVADGEIHPNEYQLVSQIATAMRIGGDEFRQALARISATMHNRQPVA